MTSSGSGPDKPGSWEWAACGASATGSQHIARGQGCDDAYGYGIAGDFVIAVVADGAGSVSGTSAWGAYAACQSVLVDAMTPEFISGFMSGRPGHAETLMRFLFDGALERVTKQAEVMRLPVARLSTTLCVAAATPDLTAFGQIGDGIIATDHDGAIETVLIEDKCEYPNATWFVQSHGAFEESYRTCIQADTDAFALSTDGMSYKVTNVGTGEAYAPFFKGSWDHVRSGANSASFAALQRGLEDDQTGDDKTMVLVTRRWEVDEFHPSPRPIRKTVVRSGAPPVPSDAMRVDVAPAAAPVISKRAGPTTVSASGSAPRALKVPPEGAPPTPAKEPDTEDLHIGPSDKRRMLRRGRRNPR